MALCVRSKLTCQLLQIRHSTWERLSPHPHSTPSPNGISHLLGGWVPQSLRCNARHRTAMVVSANLCEDRRSNKGHPYLRDLWWTVLSPNPLLLKRLWYRHDFLRRHRGITGHRPRVCSPAGEYRLPPPLASHSALVCRQSDLTR